MNKAGYYFSLVLATALLYFSGYIIVCTVQDVLRGSLDFLSIRDVLIVLIPLVTSISLLIFTWFLYSKLIVSLKKKSLLEVAKKQLLIHVMRIKYFKLILCIYLLTVLITQSANLYQGQSWEWFARWLFNIGVSCFVAWMAWRKNVLFTLILSTWLFWSGAMSVLLSMQLPLFSLPSLLQKFFGVLWVGLAV